MTTVSGESLLKCLVFGEVEGRFLATTCQHLKPLILGILPNGMPPESFAVGKRAHEDLDSVENFDDANAITYLPLLVTVEF